MIYEFKYESKMLKPSRLVLVGRDIVSGDRGEEERGSGRAERERREVSRAATALTSYFHT